MRIYYYYSTLMKPLPPPHQYSGLYTNDNGLGTEVEASAATVGEYMWRMPLVEVRV